MFPELLTRDGGNLGFPCVSRPQIIGFLSRDGSRRLLHDTSNLKFVRQVKERRVSFDLNHDMARTVRSDQDRHERLSILLQYLLEQEHRLLTILRSDKKINIGEARFFCFRGLLSCVANTPYEYQEGWHIVATLYQGFIFLCDLDTDEKKKSKQQMTEKDKLFSSWGFKFEQYVSSDTPSSEPNLSTPLNENEEFNLVLSLQLGKHELSYAAEMDGIICEEDTSSPPESGPDQETVIQYLSENKFIELKTSRHISSNRQEENFWKYKARRWWCQSYLAGVEHILCGLRDNSGVVDTLKVYDVSELAQRGRMFWRSDVCINFLDAFLTYVKRCMALELTRNHGDSCLKDVASLPATTLDFWWRPNESVRVAPHAESDDILPDWFIRNLGKKYNQ